MSDLIWALESALAKAREVAQHEYAEDGRPRNPGNPGNMESDEMTVFSRVGCGRIWLLAVLLIAGAWPASADTMLSLRNVAQPGTEVNLSEAELLAMPQTTIRTRTVFTDGVVTFTGPLARDVIARIPAGTATVAHLIAVNDYASDIPLSDLMEFDVILAMAADGKRLSIRDKGPIWVMYPLDDHPELQEQKYNPRLVWQLRTIELR